MSAPILHLSVSQRPVFLLNSCLSLFSAACSRRLPLSLSYGVILPSSLTTLLPSVCGFSPRLPVSVCGTGTYITIAAFLGSVDSDTSLLFFAPLHFSISEADLPASRAFVLRRVFPLPGYPILLRPHSSECTQYRNFNLLSIDYVFRPHLRSRLTLSRSALPRKP